MNIVFNEPGEPRPEPRPRNELLTIKQAAGVIQCAEVEVRRLLDSGALWAIRRRDGVVCIRRDHAEALREKLSPALNAEKPFLDGSVS